MTMTLEWIITLVDKIIKGIGNIQPGYIPPPIKPPTPIPTPTIPPIDIIPKIKEFDPQKHFDKPALWKYYPDTSHKIWVPYNYQDYIIPDNKLVKYFADSIEFKEITSEIGWPPVINTFLSITFKGTNKSPRFKYRIDDARLYEESGQKVGEWWKDFWINPDYYIWNELEGDCEDYILLMASVLEHMNIPYMVVNGFTRRRIGITTESGIRHVWIEFIYNNKLWMSAVDIHNGVSAKPKTEMSISSINWVPYKMFNKTTAIKEYTEWYKQIL